MTWTYTNTSIVTNLAKVRLLIGDTNTNDQILTDEEITFHIGEEGNIYLAGAACCDSIIGQFARDVDRSGVGIQATRSQIVQHYQDLAERLRKRGEKNADLTDDLIGGESESRKETLESDSDFVKPLFRNRQWANNG